LLLHIVKLVKTTLNVNAFCELGQRSQRDDLENESQV